MLYPQNNSYRAVIDLSGIWEMKSDPDGVGMKHNWSVDFKPDGFIGVPGSWNEQLAEMGFMNYIGSVWYKKDINVPLSLADKKIYLRFEAVDFHAKVWMNGEFVGEHSGGYLPFTLHVTPYMKKGRENTLIVMVNNELSHETIPQGVTVEDYVLDGKERDQSFPPTRFDFFTYGGISRPVKLLFLPDVHLREVKVNTRIEGTHGIVEFQAGYNTVDETCSVEVIVSNGEELICKPAMSLRTERIQGQFTIPDCRFWNCERPYLYTLIFRLVHGNDTLDEYQLDIGIREIAVDGDKLLLNGKQIFLKGFGKHEDFAVLGKGHSYPLIIKDYQLMQWIGANSFRTSHYPYSEEVMQMADRLGFLVIDEVPAVSLNFRHANSKTLETHKSTLCELVARDRNHPSVICWSVANEPGIWGEREAVSEDAQHYWEEIFTYVRTLDSSRPITLPACAKLGLSDPAFSFSDIISINRYWGWYEIPAEIDKAAEKLRSELEALHDKYERPIFVSEFGADTIEGQHATYPQLFTEEYQMMLIKRYFEVIESLPFTVGEHIWNFADFRTAQHHRRVVLNKKGVFNRQREPKSAAFAIRKHWRSET